MRHIDHHGTTENRRRAAVPRAAAAAVLLASLLGTPSAMPNPLKIVPLDHPSSIRNPEPDPAPPADHHAAAESPPNADAPRALDWARRFLPHYFTDQPALFHRELLADLENPSRRLIARVAPRGHAKSTCAALAYPLWCICERQKKNIVIITHESSLATQFVRDIRHELESNDLILAHYGDLCRESSEPRPEGTVHVSEPRPAGRSHTTERPQAPIDNPQSTRNPKSPIRNAAPNRKSKIDNPKSPRRRATQTKWTESMLTTSTGVTVQAKSAGASFRGTRVGPQRPDLIICDDIEKDDLVESPDARKKLEHWLRRVVMPALAPDGQLLIVGSIIHYDSLLASLADKSRFKLWDYKVYRALEAEFDDAGRDTLVALWPARWPVEKLQLERERIGFVAFEQEYQANPIDTEMRTFRPEWLRRYDPAELEHKRLAHLIAVDPATGKDAGDFFALWVGAVDQDTGVIYTRVLQLARIGIVEQVRRILDAVNLWKPVRVGIETTAYQVALKDILDDYGRRNHLHIPIVAINASANKRARVEGSAPFYENGTMRLPQTLDEEVELQFLQFPKSRHDDAPDVCAMGIELARQVRGALHLEAATAKRSLFPRNGGW